MGRCGNTENGSKCRWEGVERVPKGGLHTAQRPRANGISEPFAAMSGDLKEEEEVYLPIHGILIGTYLINSRDIFWGLSGSGHVGRSRLHLNSGSRYLNIGSNPSFHIHAFRFSRPNPDIFPSSFTSIPNTCTCNPVCQRVAVP